MAKSAAHLSRQIEASSPRRRSGKRLAGEIALGAATLAIGGFAAYLARERSFEEAAYRTIESDGAFSLRRYDPGLVAEYRQYGAIADALNTGFRPLADYIAAKPGSREAGATEKKIAMALPVIAVPADRAGAWAIRLTLPRAWTKLSLPKPANGVAIQETPGRSIAALRFSGRGSDHELIAAKHAELLEWARGRGLKIISEPEFAIYNSPIVPGALRRNEWWVEVERP